ncbi:tgb1 [Potexvirus ecsallii]|uniref:Tgb1 n=1 Tax=Potexvirus ecsallii TaxID=317027 RepID=C0L9E2_9VIRU|nr:tgb1 [Allium virus X]ACN58195.1 tgb1 [Allium virus X]
MNTLVDTLVEAGFIRTHEPLSNPLVVHAVAGAGKSSLIRRLLETDATFRAFTRGPPDPPSLDATAIQAFQPNPPSHLFNILDEYPAGEVKGPWAALFADPLQHRAHPRRPHFIKRCSHRLSASTAALLTSLGIPITGTGQGNFTSAHGVFEGPLIGKIISLDNHISLLLSNHSVPYATPDDVLGQEFPITTVISALPLHAVCDKVGLYIALSRHTSELHVLCPNPPHPTT